LPRACFDGRPTRLGGGPAVDDAQRRTLAAVYDQPVGVAQLMPDRIQHVQIDIVFSVESVCCSGGLKADRDALTGAQVQAAKAHQVVGVGQRVDASPHTDELATGDVCFECRATEVCLQLGGGGDSALRGQQGVEFVGHRWIVQVARIQR
jgi:hypothetical protein